MADEYLSGDVRTKLRIAQLAAETNPEFKVNVTALEKAQPKEFDLYNKHYQHSYTRCILS